MHMKWQEMQLLFDVNSTYTKLLLYIVQQCKANVSNLEVMDILE